MRKRKVSRSRVNPLASSASSDKSVVDLICQSGCLQSVRGDEVKGRASSKSEHLFNGSKRVLGDFAEETSGLHGRRTVHDCRRPLCIVLSVALRHASVFFRELLASLLEPETQVGMTLRPSYERARQSLPFGRVREFRGGQKQSSRKIVGDERRAGSAQ